MKMHSSPSDTSPTEIGKILDQQAPNFCPMRFDEYAELLCNLLSVELSCEIIYRKTKASSEQIYSHGREVHKNSYNQLIKMMTSQGILPVKRLPRWHFTLSVLLTMSNYLPKLKKFCLKDLILLLCEKRLLSCYNDVLIHASKKDFWKLRAMMLESKEMQSNLQMKIQTFKLF